MKHAILINAELILRAASAGKELLMALRRVSSTWQGSAHSSTLHGKRQLERSRQPASSIKVSQTVRQTWFLFSSFLSSTGGAALSPFIPCLVTVRRSTPGLAAPPKYSLKNPLSLKAREAIDTATELALQLEIGFGVTGMVSVELWVSMKFGEFCGFRRPSFKEEESTSTHPKAGSHSRH